jgi:hypothetical protein
VLLYIALRKYCRYQYTRLVAVHTIFMQINLGQAIQASLRNSSQIPRIDEAHGSARTRNRIYRIRIRARALLLGKLRLHKSRPRHTNIRTRPRTHAHAHAHAHTREGRERVFVCKDCCTHCCGDRGLSGRSNKCDIPYPLPFTFPPSSHLSPIPQQARWHSSDSTYLPSRGDLSSPIQAHTLVARGRTQAGK